MGGDAAAFWRGRAAPDLAVFETLAAEAFARLPQPFRDSVAGVAVLIRDFPEDDELAAVGLENPFDLMGLYDGVHIGRESEAGLRDSPNRILLYRRPILEYWAEHEEALDHLITHVLVHEIGHHLGLSDDDMERIEAAAR